MVFIKNILFPNFVRGLFWTFVRALDRLLEVFTVRFCLSHAYVFYNESMMQYDR